MTIEATSRLHLPSSLASPPDSDVYKNNTAYENEPPLDLGSEFAKKTAPWIQNRIRTALDSGERETAFMITTPYFFKPHEEVDTFEDEFRGNDGSADGCSFLWMGDATTQFANLNFRSVAEDDDKSWIGFLIPTGERLMHMYHAEISAGRFEPHLFGSIITLSQFTLEEIVKNRHIMRPLTKRDVYILNAALNSVCPNRARPR
jgi:hypothetical protein